MYYLIPLMMMFSISFISMNNPLSMGLVLFIQTFLISLTVGMTSYSYWFSYILFLIFLGGMLILFIYISSLSSNNSYSYNMKFNLYLFITILISISLFFIDPLLSPSTYFSSSLYTPMSPIMATKWIYSSSFMYFTLFIISYLLITLIVVVKISTTNKGPLRILN